MRYAIINDIETSCTNCTRIGTSGCNDKLYNMNVECIFFSIHSGFLTSKFYYFSDFVTTIYRRPYYWIRKI